MFLTQLKGLIQSIRLASLTRNASGSLIEVSYMARYIASSIKAEFCNVRKTI